MISGAYGLAVDNTDIKPFPGGAHTRVKGDSNKQSKECQIVQCILCQIYRKLSVNAIDKNM